MSDRSAAEDRVALWFLEEAPDEPPARVLEAAFERTRLLPQDGAFRLGPRVGTRAALVAAAALLMVGSIMAVALIGAWRSQPIVPVPSPDALQRLMSTGVLRAAVRPEHPQSVAPDGTPLGFDVDVATEIGRRLGLRVDIVAISPTELLRRPGAWDVGLPSTPAWSVRTETQASTSAYYSWPHLLLVAADSAATSVADVQGQPICAVAGDAGQDWLLGTYGGAIPSDASTPPIPSTLLLKTSDADCLAALEAGQVRGVVTATLSPADLAARPEVRAIDGPAPEPRVAVINRAGESSASLLEAVDRAIEAMRGDGTLAALSRASFGSDLTSTVP